MMYPRVHAPITMCYMHTRSRVLQAIRGDEKAVMTKYNKKKEEDDNRNRTKGI